MVKKVNKVQNNAQNNVQNQQVNNNDCQHVQLGGMAYYDAKQYFLFSPQESGVNKVPRFRSMGVAQQMPDGTFDFVVQHRLRTQSELIKKLAHEEVIDFATRTGCDSLAISIGTSHGAYKFTPEQCHIDPATGRMVPPPLAFEVLDAVMEKLPGFPIVLHGSSSVPEEEVETINKYGGALKAAIGIPEEELRKAAKSAVCKINIDSDSRLAMTAAIRKTFAEKPAEFDPRKYLGPARDNMEKLYKHKILNVLGSDNKLAQ